MNLKNNIFPIIKRTWCKRWCSSTSTVQNISNIDNNSSYFKTLKSPECMFAHDIDVAKDIADTICTHLVESHGNERIEIVEANPGPCLITKHILKNTNYNICIFEHNFNEFCNILTEVQSIYGNRVNINQGNLLLLWKLGFQDRMDRGDRASKYLSYIGTPQPWNQKNTSLKMIAALPNKKFMNYLIYSFIFQTGLMTYGRPEFYFLLPPTVFTRYSCKPIIDKTNYKTQTILFQSIFDIKLLKTYPRNAFFPPHSSKSSTKNVRFKELKRADDKYILLAKVVGRQDIFDNDSLTEDLLKPFWYFVKHHTHSRKNFVIPMLEQWIPGCGPHFINQGHNIFTQFGDLTPPQILKVFLKFISLPEYKDSPFLSTMENRVAKLLPASQKALAESIVEQSENVLPVDFDEFNNKDG